MQTFIAALDPTRTVDPLRDWMACAVQLDPKRGRKQAVEAQQLVMSLAGDVTAYAHHPVTLAWAGHAEALAWYGLVHAQVWGVRKSAAYLERHASGLAPLPAWMGMPGVLGPVVANHRSRLLAKAPEFYGPLAAPGGPWAGTEPCEDNVYPTQLLCRFQPGDQVAITTRGVRIVGEVVVVKPAGLEVRVEHSNGRCWRRIEEVEMIAEGDGRA